MTVPEVQRALANLIDAADSAETDYVFVPDLLDALGLLDVSHDGSWYANAADELRALADGRASSRSEVR